MLETKKCDCCNNVSNRLIKIICGKKSHLFCRKCATLLIKEHVEKVNNKK
jgi:hypothetical protein